MDQPSAIFHSILERAASAADLLALIATAGSTFAAIAVKAWSQILERRGARIAELEGLESLSTNWNDAKTAAILEIAALDDTDRLESVVKGLKTRDGAYLPPSISPAQIARKQVLLRITEANSMRREQLASSGRFNAVANGLTWTNFILGGVLASSFVQASVSPRWAGGLGVLVLIASLVQQKYHPELDADSASQKAAQLLATIRASEDRLVILDAEISSGKDAVSEMIGLMQSLTKRLGEIEALQPAQPPSDNGR